MFGFGSKKKKKNDLSGGKGPPAAAAAGKGDDGKDAAADDKGGDVEMTNKQNGGAADDPDDGAVGEMKRGDYMIHIYMEKTKEIKTPDGGTVDPIFEIHSLGQKVYSTSKEDIGGIGEVNWSEHIFIEAKNIEKHDADEGKIMIKLYDKGFFKQTLIGLYEFDLTYIYFMKKHVMLHKWLAFSNPNSENYSEITGYAKLSINVTCTGDDSVQIEDDDGPEDTNVLMPPSLNPQFYQVKMRFFEAQDIPPMDMGFGFMKKAKTDAYFMTEYKKKKLKTKMEVMTEDDPSVEFNQEFWIPAQIPIISKRMTVKVMDRDDINDEVVGSLLFDIQDIVDGKYDNKYFWKNIYGCPMNLMYDSQAKRDMNENPELASNWKGRVLMSIECVETEKPVCKRSQIEDEYIMQAKAYTLKKKYQMIAEVGQGVALPYDDKFSVKIMMGGEVFQTEKAKVAKKDYNRFNERYEWNDLQSVYSTIDEWGTVFVILMDDDKPICYYKDRMINFANLDAEYKWISLKPDLSVGKVTDANLAGMLSFKLAIHKVDDEQVNFKEHNAWKKLPPKRLEPVKIRAYIYQCRDLPAADSNGSSDPYVQVWDMSEDKKKKRTQTVDDNNNPLYYEVLELEYEVRDINDLYSYPPFILDVFDEDEELMDSSDDFLCRAIIEPEDCVIVRQEEFQNERSKEIPETPRWHPCNFMPGEPKCGDILVSFSVSQIDYNYMHPAKSVDLASRVEFKEVDLTMLILGLRNLQSPGIMPVRKAFIQFNLKSLVPPNSSAIQNIQTQPSSSGPNPTLNTTMTVTVPLPTDPLYCPKLACTVYDYIFKGWNQPMVGVFTLPIGQYMLDLKAERAKETEEIEKINEALTDKLKGKLGPQDFDVSVSESENRSKSANQINKSIDNEQQDTELGNVQNSEVQLDFGVKDMQREPSDIQSQIKEKIASDVAGKTRRKRKGPKASDSVSSKTEFIKDSKEKFGVDADDAEFSAEQKEDKEIKQIQARKRIAKASYLLQEQGSQANMSNLMEARTKKGKDDGMKGSLVMSKSSVKQMEHDMNPDQMPDKEHQPENLQGILQEDRQESYMAEHNNVSKTELKALMKHDKEKEKRIHEDQRKREEEEMIRDMGQDAFSVVIKPQYKKDARLKVEREHTHPSNKLYLGLGWDEDSQTNRKHYRKFYDDELENVEEIFPVKSPFHSVELMRGQSRGLPGGMFASMMKKAQKKDASGQDSTEKVVGFFKGIVEVESRHDRAEYDRRKAELVTELVDKVNQLSLKERNEELKIDVDMVEDPQERKKLKLKLRQLNISNLHITGHLTNLHSDVILKRQLMASNKCIVRLYMISAFNLSSRDNGSPSDPYLILKCNEKEYNERSNYQLDEPNPKFMKYYDFESTFPGSSPLEIIVKDYDDIFGDEVIGNTIIDIEDRYFTLEWQSLHDKPIEYRQLYHQSSSQEQGVVKCWLEINSILVDPTHITTYDIAEKPLEMFELRIVVFKAKDMKIMDWEGTSDVFFRCFFDSKEDVQETDTHYRNQDGKPDFQYRLVYRIAVPRKDYKFTLQAYDRDFFKSNDMIGEAQLNLKQIIEDCSLVKKPLTLNETYYKDVLKPLKGQALDFDDDDHPNRFWVKVKAKNAKTGKEETNGKVLMQVDVLPVDMADKNKVGKARDNPNHSPTLPQPEGRLKLSLNPFTMFSQMIGPEVRRKICIFMCCMLCLVLTAALLPNIIGTLVAQGFTALI